MGKAAKRQSGQGILPNGKMCGGLCHNQSSGSGKKSDKQIRFIDLFAGCGGLSEGFIQAGYAPVARVEMNGVMCHLHLNGMGDCNVHT